MPIGKLAEVYDQMIYYSKDKSKTYPTTSVNTHKNVTIYEVDGMF